MSRRKQARPSRAHLEEELAQGSLLTNPLGKKIASVVDARDDNDSVSEGEESTSGPAGEEAVDLTSTRSHHEDEDEKDPEDIPAEEEEEDLDDQDEVEEDEETTEKKHRLESNEDDEEGSCKRIRLCQDAENNNSFVEGAPPAGVFPSPGTSHVTLEALQNTKVAVAQFAATALAGGPDSEAAIQELASLQSTLYTLQHQQVFQLQLISQLQQQLSITQPPGTSQDASDGTQSDSKETSPSPLIQPKPLSALTSPTETRPPSHQRSSSPQALTQVEDAKASKDRGSPLNVPNVPTVASSAIPVTTSSSSALVPLSHQVAPLCSMSSSLASSIITNDDPPPLNEPDTLKMLQKRAEGLLDNASQGLLSNNLADELAFRSGKGSRLSPYDSKNGGSRSEPFFKHRCRYCGKVFGSDSALQIHIRSHTGERPFKCNVCGSRFTTKGNLKVHFQRHRDKFPHVKMNPNPIPEHMDKYHPPLLQQLAACGQRPPSSPPPPPPPTGPLHPSGLPFHNPGAHPGFLPPQPPLPLALGFPGIATTYRAPLINHREDQDMPENLSKPLKSSQSSSSPIPSPEARSDSRHSIDDDGLKQDQEEEMLKSEKASPVRDYAQPRSSSRASEEVVLKHEPEDADDVNEDDCDEFEDNPKRYTNSSPAFSNQISHSQNYEDCSMDSKISNRLDNDGEMDGDEDIDEQPENLCNRGNSGSVGQQSNLYPGASPASSSSSSGSLQNSFGNILFPGMPPHPPPPPHHLMPPGSIPPSGPLGSDIMDPARDPAIYSNLLPRPGSNDNSWESLIEITKTSETSKLQQLVDNIEHKLTDPNQCIICQRVLSCKSALQMHYRTHTGERPFKCKICGRAFTTKGNLKTHMGVHRAKPPLRLLHQCTVCHKKFNNSFVLQQHVNLHTNDPTELTPEQIRAAEVHDFHPGYPHHPLAAFLPGGFPPMHPAGFPIGFPPRPHPLDRQSIDQDMDSKDSLHHQQLQQQRYLDDQIDDLDEQDEDDEDRRDDEERCESVQDRRSIDGDEDRDEEIEEPERKDVPLIMPSFSTSLAALESQVRSINTMATNVPTQPKSPPSHRYNGSEKSTSPPSSISAPLDLTPRASSTPAFVTSAPTSPPTPNAIAPHPPNPFGLFTGLLQAVSTSPTPTNLTSAINSVASSGSISPANVGIGPLASLTTSAVRAATSAYNPLGLAIGSSAVRGNTTCNICFKTFACNSALEIHYRSHTKERPFKCSICDRGFSTKGNMKQHMLTHKIRDMPHHIFSDSKSPNPPPTQNAPTTPSPVPPMPQQINLQKRQSTPVPDVIHRDHERESRSPIFSDDSSLAPPPPPTNSISQTPPSSIDSKKDINESKKSPSASSKHLCQVCNKNFSSSSALQIHMRTHTGDKPFQCTVCQKAFTTKGNLKVHMGTHVWNNGASRRGRRMSLDIPSLPIAPKDSEFLQRRPELFYPYLPAPFLNGMPQKLNEIPVIQGGNGLPVGHPASIGKYAGLFGSIYSGGFPHDKPMPFGNGPLIDGPKSLLFQGMPPSTNSPTPPSPPRSPEGAPSPNIHGNQNSDIIQPWGTVAESIHSRHFERNPPNSSRPESPRLPAPRGEGLAA